MDKSLLLDKRLIAPYLKPIQPIPTEERSRGALRGPIKGLLCDIYGTLLVSGCGDIGTSRDQDQPKSQIGALIDKYGLSISSFLLVTRLHETIDARHQQSRAKGVAHPEIRIDELWQQILDIEDHHLLQRFAIEYEMIVNPVSPMPHLKALLTHCRRCSIRLGIISNAQFFTPFLFQWLLDQDLLSLGFDPQLTLLSYQHGIAKPSPELFKLACKQLKRGGIEPHEAAYIGNDMRNDIVPARQAGFQTVLFAGDARSLRWRADDPLCRNVEPNLVVTSLDQLVNHLDPDPTTKSPGGQ